MDASIWTKSKFMGMSIGVVMVGKGRYPNIKVNITVGYQERIYLID